MELWLEYLLRRGLKLPEETPPASDAPFFIVRAEPPVYPLWSYFLCSHRYLIRALSLKLDLACTAWTRGWMIPPMDKKPFGSPALDRQRDIVFAALPHLSLAWKKWSKAGLVKVHERETFAQCISIEDVDLMNGRVPFSPVFDWGCFIQPEVPNSALPYIEEILC